VELACVCACVVMRVHVVICVRICAYVGICVGGLVHPRMCKNCSRGGGRVWNACVHACMCVCVCMRVRVRVRV
jgi:hypothetical protein